MRVICLSGEAQSGKDTAAQFLYEFFEKNGKSAMVTHYADLLKYICKTFFAWDGNKDEDGRSLLQYVGTDIVRKNNPNYWVDFLISILSMFENEWDFVIISDARFPNEITRIKGVGIETVHARVHRNNFESPLTDKQRSHASETALDSVTPDYWLINNNIEEYKNVVEDFGMKILRGEI